MKATVYIETMGCQMNKLDSELAAGELVRRGCVLVDEADGADVIIFNTCSVRQHAEDKVISKVGQLTRRQREAGKVLAVIGCMAERLGQQLLDEHKQVDVVCGPGRLHELPGMIEASLNERRREVLLNDQAELERLEALDCGRLRTDTPQPFSAFVRVMRGCNNFCHYCIVPYVRGRERSRPIGHIVEECRRLAGEGVKEITLLGQAVNKYAYDEGGRTLGLADVLAAIHDIDGLERIHFVTNYPRDFDERIFEAMAGLEKVCEYLHMPAQSGSDRMLKAMNRRYTAAEYLALVERGREIVPELSIAGDFIVGYCGETEEDFEATKELVRRVRYKNCFVFKYSPRPGTRADEVMADDVPEDVKRRRNRELLEVVGETALAENEKLVGQTREILVAGPSKKPHLNTKDDDDGDADAGEVMRALQVTTPAGSGGERLQLVGRTRGDRIVVFDGTRDLIGQVVTVGIVKATALTLFGERGRY